MNDIVDSDPSPEIIEFEGFINYGTPIDVQEGKSLGIPEGIVVTESRIEEPVFSTRKHKTKQAEQGSAHQSTTLPESESE